MKFIKKFAKKFAKKKNLSYTTNCKMNFKWRYVMKKECSRFTLRVGEELLYKLSHISDFNGRTKNREIEQVLKKYVTEFERRYGPIPVPEHVTEEDEAVCS